MALSSDEEIAPACLMGPADYHLTYLPWEAVAAETVISLKPGTATSGRVEPMMGAVFQIGLAFGTQGENPYKNSKVVCGHAAECAKGVALCQYS